MEITPNLTDDYNESYWIKRGKRYKDEFAKHTPRAEQIFQYQEKRLLEELDKLKFDTVLEVGCGFGRITKLISNTYHPSLYDAFDVSPDQIENAKKLNLNVNYSVVTIKDFVPKITYDLVIVSEVLMHIPFSDIFETMKKLDIMTAKYLVNIDWFLPKQIQKDYCYSHDYPKYYRNLDFDLLSVSLNNSLASRIFKKLPQLKQTIFIGKKQK